MKRKYNEWQIEKSDLPKLEELSQAVYDLWHKYSNEDDNEEKSEVARCFSQASAALEEIRENIYK